ncbi:MAG: DUF6483 family protein [Clostridiales bacterium]|nr:DUF6483 family protein [Clostridiales bacterium]
MSFHEDWLIRQIEMMISALIDAVTKNKPQSENVSERDSGPDEILPVDESKIAEAESMLLKDFDKKKESYDFFISVLNFYSQLAGLSEEQLESAGYSHSLINEKVLDFCSKYDKNSSVGKIIKKFNPEYTFEIKDD